MKVSHLIILGLVLRLVVAFFGDYSTDAEAVFTAATKFYQTGVPATVGARVVYSGTSIPGSLLDLLTGFPLFLTQGNILGFALAGAIYSWLASVLIYLTFIKLSHGAPKNIIAGFVFLSPWGILFSDALNSSLMLVPASLWFWACSRIQSEHWSRRHWVVAGLSVSMAFQLHLSFVILAIGLLLLFVLDAELRRTKNFISLGFGFVLGGLTLIPYLLEKMRAPMTHVDALETNVVFNPNGVFDMFKMLGRFLTFPTAEITRFMGFGGGLQDALERVIHHLWLAPIFIVAMVGSVALVIVSLRRFYFSLPGTNLNLWVVLMPLITSILFLFSIKGPSAHTFWALFPISFYPIVMRWDRFPRWMKKPRVVGAYFVSSTLLVVLGVLPFVGRPYYKLFNFGVTEAHAAQNSWDRTLRVFLPQDAVTLDWNQSFSMTDFPIIMNLQEGLIEIDDKGNVHPLIAQSWKISPDGRTVTFALRKDVLWSDNKPLSADDFVMSWKRVMNPANGFVTQSFVADIEDVSATSAYELVVKLKGPNLNWFLKTAAPIFYPVRQLLINKSPDQWTKPGLLVNLGPFLLKEHNLNQSYLLEKNPAYFGDKGNVSKVEFKIGPLEEGVSAINEGKVDFLFYATDKEIKKISKKNKVIYHQPRLTKKIDFNAGKYPTSFQKVRYAIAQAINRDELAKFMDSRFIGGRTYVPFGFIGYDPKGGVAYNPEEAKKTIRQMFGLTKVTINVLVPCFDASRNDNIKIAQWLQKTLKENINIDLNLQLEPDEKRYSFARDNKDWHLLLREYNAFYNDPSYFLEPYMNNGRYGWHWSSEPYDLTLSNAKTAKTTKQSAEWFKKADEMLTRKDVALVPLLYQKSVSVVGPKVQALKKRYYEPYIFKSVELR